MSDLTSALEKLETVDFHSSHETTPIRLVDEFLCDEELNDNTIDGFIVKSIYESIVPMIDYRDDNFEDNIQKIVDLLSNMVTSGVESIHKQLITYILALAKEYAKQSCINVNVNNSVNNNQPNFGMDDAPIKNLVRLTDSGIISKQSVDKFMSSQMVDVQSTAKDLVGISGKGVPSAEDCAMCHLMTPTDFGLDVSNILRLCNYVLDDNATMSTIDMGTVLNGLSYSADKIQSRFGDKNYSMNASNAFICNFFTKLNNLLIYSESPNGLELIKLIIPELLDSDENFRLDDHCFMALTYSILNYLSAITEADDMELIKARAKNIIEKYNEKYLELNVSSLIQIYKVITRLMGKIQNLTGLTVGVDEYQRGSLLIPMVSVSEGVDITSTSNSNMITKVTITESVDEKLGVFERIDQLNTSEPFSQSLSSLIEGLG